MTDILPERYRTEWRGEFDQAVRNSIATGMTVLDIGAGRQPSVELDKRPKAVNYIGMDVSYDELTKAPRGSYDQVIVGDITKEVFELRQRIDLVISYQVFEHVKPLDVAFENIEKYLRPGGVMVAQVSGTFSLFGVANRLVPHRVGTWAMQKLLNRQPDTVFEAHYDHCWHGGLSKLLKGWTDLTIIPIFRGAGYLGFSTPLQNAYCRYENWAQAGNHNNLATHYVIVATK